MAASLLSAIGLPELITHSAKEYEELAIGLAHNPDRLQAINHKLQINRLEKPLFNTQLFAKNLEHLYKKCMSVIRKT
ncbi:hypothetical protein [Polynucleobacter necessarius]|uniref:O-linked N-acetylglucosamine transferase family protein n=1 Tax=Polynucleobacter necessarius TaxID=576610 RepID=UPI0039E6CE38